MLVNSIDVPSEMATNGKVEIPLTASVHFCLETP